MKRIPVGAKWRVLAHQRGQRVELYSKDYPESMTCDGPGKPWRRLGPPIDPKLRTKERAIFDELVIDDWLHIEQMDTRVWWLRIGDDMVMISIGRDGRPKMGEWYK